MSKFKSQLFGAISITTIIVCCIFINNHQLALQFSRLWSSTDLTDNDETHEDVRDYKVAKDFKEAFESAKILERTSDCDFYFSRLFSVIYSSEKQINASELFKNDTIDNADLPKVAVSYVIHDYPELFEILFHLTFKPYNSYCIYIDPKSSKEYQDLVFHILNCYQKTFPESKIIVPQLRIPVNWGGYSLLHADLQCLEELFFTSK